MCAVLAVGSIWYFENEKMEVLHFRNEIQDEFEDEESSNFDKKEDCDEQEHGEEPKKDYIKWVEFNVTCEAMNKAYQYDIETYTKEIHLDWVDLLAFLGAKYGGDFSRYQEKDMDEIAKVLLEGEKTVEDLVEEMKYFPYYKEAYHAVLGGMVGEYELEYPADRIKNDSGKKENREEKTDSLDTNANINQTENLADAKMVWKKVYGLKAYHPIAKDFPYSDYDDFGASRSFGYKRVHLGHDMMGQVGTPIIAVESGYVAEIGWNRYGGWRVGINSFDGKRYYYYAHLRKDRPYADGLEKGDVVTAGDVIGYLGRTGYSTQENVNNIDEYHLHFGLQLIFDEEQRNGNNEIWVNGYELTKFLYKNRSQVQRNNETREWSRMYQIKDPSVKEYQELYKE